jgi:hypothetical protein
MSPATTISCEERGLEGRPHPDRRARGEDLPGGRHVGEAARQVSREFCNNDPDIRWADTIGMRRKVVHDYLGVDDDIVWQVAPEDLPKLVTSLEALELQ